MQSLIPGLFLVLFTYIAGTTAVHSVELTKGMMLSNSCAGCHGTDGDSPGAIPSIKGKSAEFIVKTLTDFREGKLHSTVMGRHAKGYSDEEIKHIADHFAGIQ